MSPTFTEDDVGKTVESDGGDALGVVVAIERETAYVDPDPTAADSTRAVLDWERGADGAVPIADVAVAEITDDAIRLDESVPEESVATDAGDEDAGSAREGTAGYSPGEPIADEVADRGTDVAENVSDQRDHGHEESR